MHSCIVRWPLVEHWITCEWYKPIRLGSSRRKRAFIENAVGAEDAMRPPGQSTEVYTALPGQNAQLHCTVAVG